MTYITQDKLCLLIPCYNEQEVLHLTANILLDKINTLIANKKISSDSKIIFIDDGSQDATWDIIQKLNLDNKIFWGIKLSRNYGHQNALLAGLLKSKDFFDVTISIDADLQDDINAIDEMLEKYFLGNQIVYGVRNNRDSDSFFKKFTAEMFYKLLKSMGANIVFNHADFRLMSKKVLDEYQNFPEANLFLRGTIPMLGFKSDIVSYSRKKRLAGKTKYSLKKMLAFALDGITSLSTKPIRLISLFGAFVSFIGTLIFLASIILLVLALNEYYTSGLGFFISAFAFCLFIAMHGFQFIFIGLLFVSIGLIGEYIGKIYLETKHRPRFIIEKFLN